RKTERKRGIEKAAGNPADCIGHCQDRQAEGQRDTGEPDAELRKSGGQDGRTAASEYQPECADEFGCEFAYHWLSPFRLCGAMRPVGRAARVSGRAVLPCPECRRVD